MSKNIWLVKCLTALAECLDQRWRKVWIGGLFISYSDIIREKGLDKVTVDDLVTEVTPKARGIIYAIYAPPKNCCTSCNYNNYITGNGSNQQDNNIDVLFYYPP